ncbi:SDR family oxidoreductase [Microbacterium sp. SSW1-49]|uniref:SDR family oxidoreductase n=1 Tax=Microbacterium croceum TaxID=2851645 RepID=A0ABT0FB66_9MICO|nr:SDR family oxidoreductase [Microbacterium croceum]MCK2034934.1 SDR family oxidoreductase [Microbacterium croceum]
MNLTGTDLDGLVAVITGAASGIGEATAGVFRERGARVAVVDRALGTRPRPNSYVCDVTDASAVAATVDAIAADLGGIDVLVNNAGIGATGDVESSSDEEFAHVFDVNVLGMVRMARTAMPYLRKSAHPAIVNVSSIVAIAGVVQRAAYAASKGAVSALTLAMAADHVHERIRVNAVLPGTADTPWVERLLTDTVDAERAAEQLRRRQPLGRLVSASEVANAIAYLASPAAASTTGTLLTVDGGMGGLRLVPAS